MELNEKEILAALDDMTNEEFESVIISRGGIDLTPKEFNSLQAMVENERISVLKQMLIVEIKENLKRITNNETLDRPGEIAWYRKHYKDLKTVAHPPERGDEYRSSDVGFRYSTEMAMDEARAETEHIKTMGTYPHTFKTKQLFERKLRELR